MRRTVLVLLPMLALGGCQSGGIPALGISGCELSGIGIGTAGGALVGGLIGRNWTGALVGGAVGGAAGYLTVKAFAQQLGCEDQRRLAQVTQQAATAPRNQHVRFAPTRTSNGTEVSGYVMPVGSWHTDANGRQVRTVQQVLTDGSHTQTSTVEVASADLPPGQKGYVMPR
jgi:hypothetical protein